MTDMQPTRPWWEGPGVIAGASALAAVIVGLMAASANYWAAARTFDGKMVEIGVAILAADPGKTDVAPARVWALDLIAKHSGQPFSETDREILLHRPLKTVTQWNGRIEDFMKGLNDQTITKSAP